MLADPAVDRLKPRFVDVVEEYCDVRVRLRRLRAALASEGETWRADGRYGAQIKVHPYVHRISRICWPHNIFASSQPSRHCIYWRDLHGGDRGERRGSERLESGDGLAGSDSIKETTAPQTAPQSRKTASLDRTLKKSHGDA